MSISNEVRGSSGRASRAARSIAAIWSTSSDRDATAAVSGSGTVRGPPVVVFYQELISLDADELSVGWLFVADKVAGQEQHRVGMPLVQMGQERAR